MPACKICKIKDGEIEDRDKQIKRILSGYNKDKKFWKNVFKIMSITIGILILELILTLANGKEGVMMGFEFIRRFFIK